MNHANITTIADALALHIADITAFNLPVEFEAADPSTERASFADAMATAGTLNLTGVEWAATIDGFRRDGAEIERLEDEFDWIGAAPLQA
jgi:hypothetical protein